MFELFKGLFDTRPDTEKHISVSKPLVVPGKTDNTPLLHKLYDKHGDDPVKFIVGGTFLCATGLMIPLLVEAFIKDEA